MSSDPTDTSISSTNNDASIDATTTTTDSTTATTPATDSTNTPDPTTAATDSITTPDPATTTADSTTIPPTNATTGSSSIWSSVTNLTANAFGGVQQIPQAAVPQPFVQIPTPAQQTRVPQPPSIMTNDQFQLNYIQSNIQRRLSSGAGIKYKTKKQKTEGNDASSGDNDGLINDDECAICFCEMTLPFRTNCSHNFCFMCLKSLFKFDYVYGSTGTQQAHCPLCRGLILFSDFEKFAKLSEGDFLADLDGEWVWKYSGRNGGWWLFEPQHYQVLEDGYRAFIEWQLEERQKQLEALVQQQEAQARENAEKAAKEAALVAQMKLLGTSGVNDAVIVRTMTDSGDQTGTTATTSDDNTAQTNTSDENTNNTTITAVADTNTSTEPSFNRNDQIIVQLVPHVAGDNDNTVNASSSTDDNTTNTISSTDDNTVDASSSTDDNTMNDNATTTDNTTMNDTKDGDVAAVDITGTSDVAVDTNTATATSVVDNTSSTSVVDNTSSTSVVDNTSTSIANDDTDIDEDDDEDDDHTDYNEDEDEDDDGDYEAWLEAEEKRRKEIEKKRKEQFEQKRYCQLPIGSTTYVVDFINMVQHPIDFPTRTRKVKREPKVDASTSDTKGVSGVSFVNRAPQASQPSQQQSTQNSTTIASTASPTTTTDATTNSTSMNDGADNSKTLSSQ